MPANVIIGMQWGDEGKGRVADYFAQRSDIVARYAGGDNAGHTVTVGDSTFKLHLVPSGILHDGVACVLGGGMVINPINLVKELDGLRERGVDVSPGRVIIAENAHMITPMHIALDGAKEADLGSGKIGTTKRGIGPAYTDKVARNGIRMHALTTPTLLEKSLKTHFEAGNRRLEQDFGLPPIDTDVEVANVLKAAEVLRPYLDNVPYYLHEALVDDKTVLCEGAQGTLLDIDHGSYPFVTSSSATVGGVMTGLGIGPKHINRVIGVAKAFSTRVGAGPMPTEQGGAVAQKLRGTGENPWDEFGTTTGRPRRCGWLDTVVLRYATRINGLTEFILTKLDILSGFKTLTIANSYQIQGDYLNELPTILSQFEEAEAIYETRPGWQEDITDKRQLSELPEAAQQYITHIQDTLGIPAIQATVGPARSQIVILQEEI